MTLGGCESSGARASYAELRQALVGALSAHGAEAVLRAAQTAQPAHGPEATTIERGGNLLERLRQDGSRPELDALALRSLARLEPNGVVLARSLVACTNAPAAVRRAAAGVLAQARDEASLVSLLSVLDSAELADDDGEVRPAVAHALAAMARDDVAPRVFATWTDAVDEGSRAAHAAGTAATPPARAMRERLLATMRVLGARRHEPAVAKLARTARTHPAPEVATEAQRALVAIGTNAALDALADSITGAGDLGLAVYGALARDYELGFAFLAHCLDPDRLARESLAPGEPLDALPMSHRRAERLLSALVEDAEHVLATPPAETTPNGAPVSGWLEDERWAEIAVSLAESGVAIGAARAVLAARDRLVTNTSGFRRRAPDARAAQAASDD